MKHMFSKKKLKLKCQNIKYFKQIITSQFIFTLRHNKHKIFTAFSSCWFHCSTVSGSTSINSGFSLYTDIYKESLLLYLFSLKSHQRWWWMLFIVSSIDSTLRNPPPSYTNPSFSAMEEVSAALHISPPGEPEISMESKSASA